MHTVTDHKGPAQQGRAVTLGGDNIHPSRTHLCIVCIVCRLAKERSAEDHLFGDKEKFVTSAYRKKLEEDKKWLAQEKIREAQEQKNDVVKKGHMGDFYR